MVLETPQKKGSPVSTETGYLVALEPKQQMHLLYTTLTSTALLLIGKTNSNCSHIGCRRQFIQNSSFKREDLLIQQYNAYLELMICLVSSHIAAIQINTQQIS